MTNPYPLSGTVKFPYGSSPVRRAQVSLGDILNTEPNRKRRFSETESDADDRKRTEEEGDDVLPSPSASPCHVAEYAVTPPADSEPGSSQKRLVYELLRHMDRGSLSELTNFVNGFLKRDILASLPPELALHVLSFVPPESMSSVSMVSRRWNSLVESTDAVWRSLLVQAGLINEHELELFQPLAQQQKQQSKFWKKLFLRRHRMHANWLDPHYRPRQLSVRGHSTNVVTCLLFTDDGKIISGADDKVIHVYCSTTGQILRSLEGHEGGVWAMQYLGNQLVSGSTDRTIRVWDLESGVCTHVFRGHGSTVRCLDIVSSADGNLIVSGSRDSNLHVWRLPPVGGTPYVADPLVLAPDASNPYFAGTLVGHSASVRSVNAAGGLVCSGSYDHTVKVWDLKTLQCKYTFSAHEDRVYTTVLDSKRNRCISAGMDSKIIVHELNTGTKIATLLGHTSLVGLLMLSDHYLVSAAADGTLRVWDADTYEEKFMFQHEGLSAITTLHVYNNLLVSGSERQLNIMDLNTGKCVNNRLLRDSGQIWGAKFNYKRLAVAVERPQHTTLELFDFGSDSI